jgi:hypothetical protein
VVPLDVPIIARPKGPTPAVQDVIRFGTVRASAELINHLEANRLHYSRTVFQRLDEATIAGLLAKFTYRGLPMTQVVEPQPIAVTANFLVFRVNVPLKGAVDDDKFTPEQTDFLKFLQSHGLQSPVPKTELIPLPSGGVFAEAVLGRFNAAEKIDLTRFWNWQDSPIPITASEIAPVEAGSRATTEDLKPGQLGAPIVTIQTPTTLPGAAGLNPILSAVQNGNIFRDMSGLAQASALAQGAVRASGAGATAAGDQAAKNLFTVMDQHTQRMKIAADMLGSMMGASAAGAGNNSANQPAGRGTVSERGGQLNAAAKIDQGQGAGGGATPEVDAISGAGALAPRTLQEQTLANQTGGGAADAAAGVVQSATQPDTAPKTPSKPKTSPTPGTGSGTSGGGTSTTPGSGSQPAAKPVVKVRLDVFFDAAGSAALQGDARVNVTDVDDLANIKSLFDGIGNSGGAVTGFFETTSRSINLDVKAFTRPGTTGVRLDGVKTVLIPVPGGIVGTVAIAVGSIFTLTVRAKPVVKTTTLTVPSALNVIDQANLENQLQALGITADKRIGTPKVEFDGILVNVATVKVRHFTGVLALTQVI